MSLRMLLRAETWAKNVDEGVRSHAAAATCFLAALVTLMAAACLVLLPEQVPAQFGGHTARYLSEEGVALLLALLGYGGTFCFSKKPRLSYALFALMPVVVGLLVAVFCVF